MKGRIQGLADSGTSTPSQVFIDTAPAALGLKVPVDALISYPNIIANLIEVTGGNLINTDFLASSSNSTPWRWIHHSNTVAMNNFLDTPEG